MGLFGEAGARFLRTRYKNVQTLAEELFSVFTGAVDLEPQSITINQPAGATIPPITINQVPGTTTPAINIVNGDTVIQFGGSAGGGGGGGGGGIDLADIQFPGQEPEDVETAVPPPALNPIPLHGLVLGKEGGNTYRVRCWAKNPDLYPSIGVLQVVFPDVSSAETIPAGLRCPVIMFPKIVFNVIQPDLSIGYVPVFASPVV